MSEVELDHPLWRLVVSLLRSQHIPHGDLRRSQAPNVAACCLLSTSVDWSWRKSINNNILTHFSDWYILDFLRANFAKEECVTCLRLPELHSLLLDLSSPCCEVNTFFKSTWVGPKPKKMKHDNCCPLLWNGDEGNSKINVNYNHIARCSDRCIDLSLGIIILTIHIQLLSRQQFSLLSR